MKIFEITLTAGPQTFLMELNSTQRRFVLKWCEPAGCWMLDIEAIEGTPIVQSIAMVPGVDLLKQFPHLGFNSQLFVQIEGNPNKTPGYADAGAAMGFYLVTP